MDTPPSGDKPADHDVYVGTPLPCGEFPAHSDLLAAVTRCGETTQHLPPDTDQGGARARTMVDELIVVARAAARSVLTDPTLATEPETGHFRLVDLFCEIVRQECQLLRNVFSPHGIDRWPTADRWAEAEALHERALQFGARIPELVPRKDHDTPAGCQAISLARLATWHGVLAEAAASIRDAVNAAQLGLPHTTPQAHELTAIADQLGKQATHLEAVRDAVLNSQHRALGLPTH